MRDLLGLGGLQQQLGDLRVQRRAALDDRARAERMAAVLALVDAGRVGGVRDVNDDRDVRARRVSERARAREGDLLLDCGDRDDVASGTPASATSRAAS